MSACRTRPDLGQSPAPSGRRFDNRYCWVIRFANDKIVEVRAYLDSALVQKLIDENET